MPPPPVESGHDADGEPENVEIDDQSEGKPLFIVINIIIEVVNDERESDIEDSQLGSDDESSALDSSSSSSSQDDNSALEEYWLFPANGCAVCESCLQCLKEKRRLNIENCQRKSHCEPTDGAKFNRVEFFGASTDNIFRFFDKCPGLSYVLDQLKGVDIVANVCRTCHLKMVAEVKKGMFFSIII